MTIDETEPLTAEEEAELQEEIVRAMSVYEGLASPALLAQLRDRLEEGLRAHPVPRAMLRRMAARPRVEASGDVARHGDEAGEATDKGRR